MIESRRLRLRGTLEALRGFSLRPDQKLTWLTVSVAVAFLCGLGLSWRLWISSRLFPLSPISDLLPPIPFPFDYLLAAVLFGSLLATVVVPHPRGLLIVFLVLAGLLSLWDQMRWQPWFYQYFFMMAAITICAWQKPDAKSRVVALDTWRLIVIATYFWSGAQKLNATFVNRTWADIAGPALRFLPKGLAKLPAPVILAIPMLEIAIALGLLTRKTRRPSVIFATATHVVILSMLISSGENTVVWPWNAAQIVFVWVLFWGDQNTRFFERSPASIFQAIVFLLFAVLPVLSFASRWDSYLSWALYSGNTDQAVIYLSPAAIHYLPQEIHPHVWQERSPYFLDINRWAYGELNVPVYPEPRVFRRVAQAICGYADSEQSGVRLRIFQKPQLLNGTRESQFYDCDHLRDP